MMAKDYYNILGVSRGASKDEIKKAYRRLAHQHHPDKAGGNAEKFKEINEAYQTLSDDQKRGQYDQFGQTFEGASAGRGASDFSGGFGGFSARSAQGGSGWEDIFRGFGGFSGQSAQGGSGFSTQGGPASGWEDIFDIFGGGFGTTARRSAKTKGNDIEVDIEITLEEVALGAAKVFSLYKAGTCQVCKGSGAKIGTQKVMCSQCKGSGKISQTRNILFGTFQTVAACPECEGEGKVIKEKCPSCKGEGRIKEPEEITITIPAGVYNGDVLEIQGKGEAGRKGGRGGDLYVRIRVKPHPFFVRKESDVLYKAELNFATAALGGEIEVPTLYGKEKITVSLGAQSGEKLYLKGKGLPRRGSWGKGDQIIEVSIKVPKRLSKKAQNLLRELRKEL